MNLAFRSFGVSALLLLAASTVSSAAEPIQLANNPALSPDGKTLAFSWGGEIWTVPSAGGTATPLTRNSGRDREPKFSPDGKTLAFISNRDGSDQVYVMPAVGGVPKQLTHHTSGYALEGWYPDGQGLLVSAVRDHFWKGADRFFRIKVEGRGPEIPLFDAAGRTGSLSPDGSKLLFTREGPQWWRKGYVGSQASQIWLFDMSARTFTKLLDAPTGSLSPLWKPDGKGFYYVGTHHNSFNIREYTLATKADVPITDFDDDSVVYPCLSKDGSTLVFRRLFDFYRLDLTKPGAKAVKLAILNDGDPVRDPIERRSLTTATDVAFTDDGLEIAFISGGDVWVMDTELREPKQVTNTPEEERNPVFSPDGSALFFISDQGGKTDLRRADRADKALDWWRNSKFNVTQITNDAAVESDLKFSPDGSRLAFVKGRGDLWVVKPDGNDSRLIHRSWNNPDYDWSPDGAWVVFAEFDDDFNRDIWIMPIDGSKAPFNVSRHPDNEDNPVWSPDGKMIAFTGRRVDREVDIYYVYLQESDDQRTTREKTLEKAVDKVKKARAAKSQRKSADPLAATKGQAQTKGARPGGPPAGPAAAKPAVKVAIDFEGLNRRLRRVSIENSSESNLLWSPDSKRLGFRGAVDARPGFYLVDVPDGVRPTLLASPGGSHARWLEEGNQIVWLSQGVPASVTVPGGGTGSGSGGGSVGTGRFGGGSPPLATPAPAPADPSATAAAPVGGGSGRETAYRFRALQVVDLPSRYMAGFDLAWRTMRDNWYDERLGNRDWNAVRSKYLDMAKRSPDVETLATVINLMLGELNGSHLGFIAGAPPSDDPTPGPGPGPRRGLGAGAATGEARTWTPTTAHLGVRFEQGFAGPGWKVRDVIPDSPAARKECRLVAGEVVLTVDGTKVDASTDPTEVLNGPLDREIRLTVKGVDGKEREVVVRPIALGALSPLLYEKWLKDNRAAVDKLSQGTLGYLHIRGMDFPSFYRFEEELYSAGVGKDGLIIDVRENGGGSTADHLLTVLTQPHHAIAVPRGGGPGYPQDRRVYATWNKPIVVLCNQNSFSNAEIFSHAVKTLKRGHLVGVPTAGGVVSTGATRIMDLGTLRMPTRGWFTAGDGEDMELHGAVPDVVVWPEPAEFAKGEDAQLAKGVEVLLSDVKAEKAKPKPKLRKATERPGRAAGK